MNSESRPTLGDVVRILVGGPDLTVDSTVNRWRSYWTGLVVASLAKDALPVTLVGHFPSAPVVDVQRIGPLQLASE